MPKITKEYYDSLVQANLIMRGDWVNIAKFTKQAGLQNGKGFTRHWVRQVTTKNLDTSEELVQLIRSYYEPRLAAHQQQLKVAKKIKEMKAI